jgi:hypothetical protein
MSKHERSTSKEVKQTNQQSQQNLGRDQAKQQQQGDPKHAGGKERQQSGSQSGAQPSQKQPQQQQPQNQQAGGHSFADWEKQQHLDR